MTYKRIALSLSPDFTAETVGQKGVSQKYSTHQDSHSGSTNRSKTLQMRAKAKGVQYHQTSFTTTAKGTSLGGKHKRRKQPTKNKPKTIKNRPCRVSTSDPVTPAGSQASWAL